MNKKALLALLAIAIFGVAVSLQSCGKKPETAATPAVTGTGGPIKAVPLPDPHIAGFKCPEPQDTIDKWIVANDTAKEYRHSWGVWTALTMNSGEKYNGEDLRVFETWLTDGDISDAIKAKNTNLLLDFASRPRTRGKFQVPDQITHARKMHALKATAEIPQPVQNRLLGFVKYDPTAAEYAIHNTIYDSSTLQGMLNAGQKAIPNFPNSAVTLKPVFEFITPAELDSGKGFYKLNVWSGPKDYPTGYGEGSWPGWVYVDPADTSHGNGSVDTGAGRTSTNSYNIDDFIHFKLDAATVASLKANFNIQAVEGNYAILVAMHVTTRETTNWTWETFWWAPNPDAPPSPSSSFTANLRPAELTGAPRHYAMAAAYQFIIPAKPGPDASNVGTSIYAYNPYLEAGFGNDVFAEPAKVITGKQVVINNIGVKTNCMACHALSAYSPATDDSHFYMADTYIDSNSTHFNGMLRLDFAWSIHDNVIIDTGHATKK